MLLGNYTTRNANPGRNIGGFTNSYDWMKFSNVMKFYIGNSNVINITTKSSFNNGYTPPYSWSLAPKAGGLVMNTIGSSSLGIDLIPQYLAVLNLTGTSTMISLIEAYGNLISNLTGSNSWSSSIQADGNIEITFQGSGDVTASIKADGYIDVNMSGDGDLSASLSLFLNMISAMTGSGSLSADASLLISMLCDMSGGSTMTIGITGQKEMQTSLTGTGNLSADIFAFAEATLDMIGSGSLNAGTGAIATMSIDMAVTGTGLNANNVGQAVWSALQSSINNPGTAGAALLSAGSSGDPWSTILPQSYTSTQAGSILDKIKILIEELHKINGLTDGTPAKRNQSSIEAGTIKVDVTFDENGETTLTRND